MAPLHTGNVGNSRSHVESHAQIDNQVVYPQPLRQRAGNEPRLMYSTADTPPNDVNSWFQSLPKSFPDSREGFVGELISLCRELFIEVRHTIGGREGSSTLYGLQQGFTIWIDEKDRLDERLNGASDARAQIVADLVALIVVLSEGLQPSRQQARLPETRRVIEQASRLARQYIDQSRHYENTDLAEYIPAASNAIRSRLDNLKDLSPTIDRVLEEYEEADSRDAREGNAVTREEIPSALLLLFQKFPNAQDRLISRCLAANRLRAKGFSSSHLEVDGHHDSSSGGDDGEAPPSSSSKPKTGLSSNPSTSFFGSSLASRLLSKPNTRSGTASTSLLTESNLFTVGQTDSSDSHARRCLECPLCKEEAKDPADYKKHMLVHIPPYHCCFEDCDDGLPLFSNLQDWFDHEFLKHRVHIRWECRYCQKVFNRPDLYEDHLSQVHGKQPAHKPMDKILEDSREKEPRPVQNEQCIFCSQSAFESREEYKLHVGEHMEEIASLVVPSLILATRCDFLDIPRSARKVSRLCGRISQPARRPYKFLKAQILLGYARARTDDELRFRLLIWDPVKLRDFSHWAFLDTGTKENFIVRSVAEKLSLDIQPLAADDEPWKTSNEQEVHATGFVEPEWRRDQGRQLYKNIRFFAVDSIPEPGFDVILGREFIKARKLLRLNKSHFVLHRNKAGTGQEKQQQDKQKRDTVLRETEIKAAIKAQRDVSQAASSQITQTAKSEHQSSQKKAQLERADARRR